MDAEFEIARNFPWCDEYDTKSFTGILHEKQIWDDNEYLKFDKALFLLKNQYKQEEYFPRKLVYQIVRLFGFYLVTLGAHFDHNDGYKIRNYTDEEVIERRERLTIMIEGVFSENTSQTVSFDYQNHLL